MRPLRYRAIRGLLDEREDQPEDTRCLSCGAGIDRSDEPDDDAGLFCLDCLEGASAELELGGSG